LQDVRAAEQMRSPEPEKVQQRDPHQQATGRQAWDPYPSMLFEGSNPTQAIPMAGIMAPRMQIHNDFGDSFQLPAPVTTSLGPFSWEGGRQLPPHLSDPVVRLPEKGTRGGAWQFCGPDYQVLFC
jgi:hypothetical protein